jgi:predicted dehydrogenase
MLEIGLIGLGPEWEEQYRPALGGLRQRLRVTAVYDFVASRGAQVAAELGAAHVTGMRALLERADVAAVLIPDTAWTGLWPLRFAMEYRKPAFIARVGEQPLAEIDELHAAAHEAGILVVPELRHRATPATMRLRELTATRLGPVDSLQVEVEAGDTRLQSAWVAALDWSSFVAQSAPLDVTAAAGQPAARFRVRFKRTTARGSQVEAEIHIRLSTSGPDQPVVTASVTSAAGSADVLEPHMLVWRCGADEFRESLGSERPGLEVLLGHFARRIVGGLVPVPDLADVCRVVRLIPSGQPGLSRPD